MALCKTTIDTDARRNPSPLYTSLLLQLLIVWCVFLFQITRSFRYWSRAFGTERPKISPRSKGSASSVKKNKTGTEFQMFSEPLQTVPFFCILLSHTSHTPHIKTLRRLSLFSPSFTVYLELIQNFSGHLFFLKRRLCLPLKVTDEWKKQNTIGRKCSTLGASDRSSTGVNGNKN